MTFEYVDVGTGTVLDTVTLNADGGATYVTGKARKLVEGKQAILGVDQAAELLRDWTNGYALTREITTT